MNKLIKMTLITGITLITLGTTTNVVSAAKVDKSSSELYSKDVHNSTNGVHKLLGKKWKYILYEFKLTKEVNVYYLHYSNKSTMYNKIIGQTSFPKGTVVTAEYSGTGGSVWNLYGHKKKLPKNVSLTAVLTNKNAKIVSGNFKTILKQAEQNKSSN